MKQSEELDSLDFTVIRFNKDYSIRGRLGMYLTANIEEALVENQPGTSNALVPATTSLSNKAAAKPSKTYLLGVNGQGIGQNVDSLQFVSIDNK